MKHSLEVVRRVYDDEEGVCVEVGPSADNPEWLELRTSGKENIEYYGVINILMPAQMARLVAAALVAAADDAAAMLAEKGKRETK